jgi:hypothetical protein
VSWPGWKNLSPEEKRRVLDRAIQATIAVGMDGTHVVREEEMSHKIEVVPEPSDPTEMERRRRQAELNDRAAARAELEKRYTKVWDTDEMQRDYAVVGFMAPFIVVRRKSDDQLGSLEFQHSPRFYFNFMADKK